MRQRLLRPGFFQNDVLASLPPLTRLLFAGLWCIADREGRLEDRPTRIKGLVFPFESVDVEAALVALDGHGFIQRYEVEGEKYIAISKFTKHQFPHHKEVPSVIPAPKPRASPGLTRGKPRVRLGSNPEKVGASPEKEGTSPEKARTSPSGSTGSTVTGSTGSTGSTESGSTELRPSAAGRFQEACQDWIDRFNGTAPGGRIGKALKPIVERHGWERVRPAWQNYLAQSEAAFASPERFAATFGEWSGDRVVPLTPRERKRHDVLKVSIEAGLKGGVSDGAGVGVGDGEAVGQRLLGVADGSKRGGA